MTNFNRDTYDFGEDKIYTFRSGWEANYSLYLDWLKKQKQIKDWIYEPLPRYEFIVTEGNRQRALSLGYLPDFKVINNDDDVIPLNNVKKSALIGLYIIIVRKKIKIVDNKIV